MHVLLVFEIKLIEATTICFGLKNIFSLQLSDMLVESDCLEVVNMLNDEAVDISKASFYIEEAKDWGCRILSSSS